MPTKSFFKVVVLDINIYETTIKDERHFADYRSAQEYANTTDGYAIIIEM